MKLWDKGYLLNQLVEKFMTGDDPILDQALIVHDCLGSMAHAKMLAKIGVISEQEGRDLVSALTGILQLAEKGEFTIQWDDEDVHTAVENVLIQKLGGLGKKLHTARSRNDQVLLDLRLYMREQILLISKIVCEVSTVLLHFAAAHQAVPIPGRTHFQRAMPSSLGLWASAFAEALLDDLELLKNAYWLADQSPLGSAASYGVSLNIDRAYVAELLGFRTVQNNVLYANNSRGKIEAAVLHALTQVMLDLSKISTDIVIFCTPEFGYLQLPEQFCPGSSLMPQKRNPCPLELIRAKAATVQSYLFQVLEICRGLPSGYNRDFQETKRPLMQGFEVVSASLQTFKLIVEGLKVNQEMCLQAFTPEVFATDRVLELVQAGVPFRDAYKEVGLNPQLVAQVDPLANILAKTHQGATGNLGLEVAQARLRDFAAWIEQKNTCWLQAQKKLLQ